MAARQPQATRSPVTQSRDTPPLDSRIGVRGRSSRATSGRSSPHQARRPPAQTSMEGVHRMKSLLKFGPGLLVAMALILQTGSALAMAPKLASRIWVVDDDGQDCPGADASNITV